MGCFGWDFKVMAAGEWADVDKDYCVVNREGSFG